MPEAPRRWWRRRFGGGWPRPDVPPAPGATGATAAPEATAAPGAAPVERPRTSPVGTTAPIVAGVTPAGELAALQPGGGAVLFLTSSCLACRDVWAALTAGAPARDGVAIAAVVTPDATLEDRAAVARLAGDPAHPVVMSSGAWRAYGAGGSPWVAVVMGGLVAAEGPAGSWADVVALVRGPP